MALVFSISIDLVKLSYHKLLITEYLTLQYIHEKNLQKENKLFFRSFSPSESDYKSLINKGFIVTSLFSHTGYDLAGKGIELFPSADAIFERFYGLFPHKVPDGTLNGYRPVSTKDSNSNSAKKTRKIWDAILGTNHTLANDIIIGLSKELTYRTQNNTLMYLTNVDTWLSNHSWEKWVDLDIEINVNNNSTGLNVERL